MMRWDQTTQDLVLVPPRRISGPRSTHDRRKDLRAQIDLLRASHHRDAFTRIRLARLEQEYERLGGKLPPDAA